MPERASAPLVSVVVPIFNHADFVVEALRSALAQTYENLEVVVVDNRSTDGTTEILRGLDDPRLRLHVNAENIGYHRNINRGVELSRGSLLKFLHGDDVLMPDCVQRMVESFASSERVGLVFAPRRVELSDESDAELLWWRDTYGHPHRRFSHLEPVNDGRRLLREYLAARFESNWIGEPSSVMIRRACVERLGLFSLKVLVANDLDMWVRIMALYDVGFVDEELSVYRFGFSNLTTATKKRRLDWLDRLWMLEGLIQDDEIAAALPELARTRRAEYRMVVRSLRALAREDRLLASTKLLDLAKYATWRIRAAAGRAEPLHPVLARTAGPTFDAHATFTPAPSR